MLSALNSWQMETKLINFLTSTTGVIGINFQEDIPDGSEVTKEKVHRCSIKVAVIDGSESKLQRL